MDGGRGLRRDPHPPRRGHPVDAGRVMPGRRIGPVGPAAGPRDRARGHRPLARVDAADLRGDGHRAAARDDPVDGFLLPEGVAGLGLPGHVGPAAGEADRRAERLAGLARVEPVGRGEQFLDRLRGPLGHVVRGLGGRRLGLGGGRGPLSLGRTAATATGPWLGPVALRRAGSRPRCGGGGTAGRRQVRPAWLRSGRAGRSGPAPSRGARRPGRGQRMRRAGRAGRGGAGGPGPRLSRPGRGVSAPAALLVLLRRRHRVPSRLASHRCRPDRPTAGRVVARG